MDSKLKSGFQKAKNKAEDLAKNNERVKGVLKVASAKLKELSLKNDKVHKAFTHLEIFIRMLTNYFSKEYTQVPWRTIVTILGGVIYFVNPFDLIPDFIVGIGLLDDMTILFWVSKNIAKDLEDFLIWEKENKRHQFGIEENED